MRILYASLDSVQEGVGASQILPLVIELKKAGVDISLLTFEKHNPPDEMISVIERHGVDWHFKEFKKTNCLEVMRRFGILYSYCRKYDFVHARSDFAALAAALAGSDYLWDVRSFWAEQRAHMTSNFLKRIFFRFFAFFEGFIFNRCLAFTTLTTAAQNYFLQKYKPKNKKFDVVSTFVDLDLFHFNPVLPDTLSLIHSGTFNELYDLNQTVLFVRALKSLQLTKFTWARPLESESNALLKIADVVTTATREQMNNLIAKSSAGLSICRTSSGNSLIAASPTKIAEYLATGRPIVVNKGLGDFDEIIQQFNIGITIADESLVLEQADKLIQLLADPDLPRRCRLVAETFFSLEKSTFKYINLYNMHYEK